MKLLPSVLITLLSISSLSTLGAQVAYTPFEQALYDKVRYDTLLTLNDADLAAYCITMNLRAETLARLSAEITTAESELQGATSAGFRVGSPKIDSINATLSSKRQALTAEIRQIRKALATEATIARNTLAALKKAPG